jgi:c-di-GMP-binding flagellar brake protein YcgR
LSTSIIQTPKIDLTNKNVSLSGTTIDITGTGEVVKLSNNSTLSGSGHIQVGTGVSLYNDTTNTLSTSDDFEILLKRKNGELITSSNS